VLSPDGDPNEIEGVLNPASARDRSGQLLLYRGTVQKATISRVGRVAVNENADGFGVRREGYALQPEAPYELRPSPGYGCEDARVTFVPAIDRYVMAYTAYGPSGPRIAVAVSDDAHQWERVGLDELQRPGAGRPATTQDGRVLPRAGHVARRRRVARVLPRPMLHSRPWTGGPRSP